jgi:hypothetical protein
VQLRAPRKQFRLLIAPNARKQEMLRRSIRRQGAIRAAVSIDLANTRNCCAPSVDACQAMRSDVSGVTLADRGQIGYRSPKMPIADDFWSVAPMKTWVTLA